MKRTRLGELKGRKERNEAYHAARLIEYQQTDNDKEVGCTAGTKKHLLGSFSLLSLRYPGRLAAAEMDYPFI